MAKKNARAPYLRLTQPLVRDAGELRPATWEEALDRAADGFRRNSRARAGRVRACSPAPARPTR